MELGRTAAERAWGLGGAAALAVAGPWAATLFIADVFAHQAALGAPLQLGGLRLYPPFAVFDWSQRWGAHYPKPFAVAGLMAFLGLLAGAGLALLIAKASLQARAFGAHGWAKMANVRAAGLLADEGTVLGRFERELLCFAGEGHQLLIGPSRKGKGRSHVIPTLLGWPHAALVLDIKNELANGDARHGFPGTSGFRARLGPTLIFAPTAKASARWNPLFEIRRGDHEVGDVQNLVENIVDPGGAGAPADFWDRTARMIITGVVLHVLYGEPLERKTLAVVREKLSDLKATAEEMRRTLHRRNPKTGAPEVHPEVLKAATSFLADEERLQSSVRATAQSYFGIFADPIVAENTAASDFRLSDLVCGPRPMTLYLQPAPADAARLMPLLRFLVAQVGRSLMASQTHDAAGRTKNHRLLLVLDEFPLLGRVPFFEHMMGAMAGYGLKAYLVCQSPNHIRQTYGRDNTIVDNCQIVTAFGTSEPGSAEWISALGGKVFDTIEQVSRRQRAGLFGADRTITAREEERALIPAKEVQTLPDGDQLIFVRGFKPIRAKKIAYDREPGFQARLRPAAENRQGLTARHDWIHVAPLGRLEPEPAAPTPPRRVDPRQADLPFADASPVTSAASEREDAGRRRPSL